MQWVEDRFRMLWVIEASQTSQEDEKFFLCIGASRVRDERGCRCDELESHHDVVTRREALGGEPLGGCVQERDGQDGATATVLVPL